MARIQLQPILGGTLDMVNPAEGAAARLVQVPRFGGGTLLDRPDTDLRFPVTHLIGGEIVFVDQSVANLATLLAGLKPGIEVVMLDASRDALAQIADALAGRDSLGAIHIIANGGEGRIDFGAGSIGLADLAAHADALGAIGGALGLSGDLLLWSCDTGADALGQAFVDALAAATGADVAASTGATGATALGGDWTLELHNGAIEALVPLTPEGIQAFDALLDDAPDGADATLAIDEDGSHVFAVADFGFDDGVEGNLLTGVVITTLPTAGTLLLDADGAGGDDPVPVAEGQTISADDIANGRLVYVPDADGNGVGYASFTFQVQDDGGNNDLDPVADTITFDVTAINDAPVLDLDFLEPGNDAVASFSEGDGPLLLAWGAVFDDDNVSFDGAVLTIAFTANGTADDQLTINDMGTGPGLLGVSGSDITYDGDVVGSFTGGDNGNPLVITFNALACHCAIQLAMENILFSNASAAIDTSDRTIAFTLVDGGGTDNGGFDTATADVVLSITAGNDAPTVDITTDPLAATEQVALDLKGSITIGDADSGSDIISVTLSVTEGIVAVDAGTSGVLIDDSDPQHIVLTGTLAEIQALLGSDPNSSVTYTYDDDFPPFATIELSVTIDDGNDSSTDTVTIGLTSVNDAAELDLDYFTPGNDAAATYVQGDPATPIAYNATFDDDNIDWDGATLTIAIAGATADDQLSIDETLLLDVTIVGSDVLYQGDVVGTWSGGTNGTPLVVTFNEDACACAIEEVTYGITYRSTASNLTPGTRDVTFTFVDGDGTDNGGSDTAVATVELTLVQGITPPVVDAGAAAIGNEDSPIALTGVSIADAGDPVTGLITVHLSVANGTLSLRLDVVGGIDATNIASDGGAAAREITITATPDQINATLAAANGLVYLGDSDFAGTDALTITANDAAPSTPLLLTSLGALPFGDFPSALAIADVDGDTLGDLVIGLGDGSSPGAVILFASGVTPFGLPSGTADSFAFGDFDGDSAIDIGFASYAEDGSGYVGYISSLDGDVHVLAAIPYALDLVSGDFNADGLIDLAVADSDNGRIAILLQTAPGIFAPPVYSATTGLLTVTVRTGDFNGDGIMDLLAGNYGSLPGFDPPGSIDLFLGNGDGTFAAAVQAWTGPSNVGGLVVADFNGDGIDDFAFASVDSSGAPGAVNGIQVSLGNGDGTFRTATGYTTTATGAPTRIVAGDLNGDGIADLVVTNFDIPGTFSVLVGNGDGSFQAPVTFDTGDMPYSIALGDVDGDGDLDLLVGNSDGTIEAFNNDSDRRGGSAVKAITVNQVNDGPSGANATLTLNEDSSRTLTTTDFTFSDTDGNTLAGVKITTLATAGTLFYDADGAGGNAAVAVTLGQTISAADIVAGKLSFAPAANGNGLGYASFTFQVQDNGGTANTGLDLDQSPNTVTFNVTGLNDAPTGAVTITGTTAENQVLTANTAALADADGLGTLHYHWQRDDGGVFVDIGSDQATYTLVAGDVGDRIRVTVTYGDGGGTEESVTSAETGVIAAGIPAPEFVFDLLNAAPWWAQITTFAAGGAIATETVVLDNGGVWVNTYDPANLSSIAWETKYYATGGNWLQHTVTFDDGTHALTIRDLTNAFGWEEMTLTYDANWNQTGLTGTRDDGSHTITIGEAGMALDTTLWFARPYDKDFDPLGTSASARAVLPISALLAGGNDDGHYGLGGPDAPGGDIGAGLFSGVAGNDYVRIEIGDEIEGIDLGRHGFADFDAVLARMIGGADVAPALGDPDQAALEHVTFGTHDSGDFLFG